MSNSFVTPCTIACQALSYMEFSRQEYWSGLPCSSPGDLPDPRIQPVSPALQQILDCLNYQDSDCSDDQFKFSMTSKLCSQSIFFFTQGKNDPRVPPCGLEIGLWDLEFLIWFPTLLLSAGQAGFMRSVGSGAMVLWGLLFGVSAYSRERCYWENQRC